MVLGEDGFNKHVRDILAVTQAIAKGVREIKGGLVVDRQLFYPARADLGAVPFDEAPEFPYNVIPDALYLFELDWAAVRDVALPVPGGVSEFPSSRRDLAFVVEESVTAPIDQQVNGATDMLYINGVSGDDGSSAISGPGSEASTSMTSAAGSGTGGCGPGTSVKVKEPPST